MQRPVVKYKVETLNYIRNDMNTIIDTSVDNASDTALATFFSINPEHFLKASKENNSKKTTLKYSWVEPSDSDLAQGAGENSRHFIPTYQTTYELIENPNQQELESNIKTLKDKAKSIMKEFVKIVDKTKIQAKQK